MHKNNLNIWQEKIQEKRKKTPFLQAFKEFVSWKPLSFYKNQGMITRYSQESRVKNIVGVEDFFKMRDNLPSREYDTEKSFFDNFASLFFEVPQPALLHFNRNENANYADCVFTGKNIYLSNTIGIDAENIFYSIFCYDQVKNVFNSFMVMNKSQNVYHGVGVNNSYNIFYSKFISDSSDVWFSTNLIGCRECIFCDGLQNKKFYIENKSYSEEDYKKKKEEILKKKNEFMDFFKGLTQKAINYASTNVVGNALTQCEDVENGIFFTRLKTGRNVGFGHGVDGSSEFYDAFDAGVNSHKFYGVLSAGENSQHLYCSAEIGKSSYIYYSYFLESCSFCLGCVGLKNKHFCILNKEYPKEEWYKLVDKIFSQMEKDEILGDFFPGNLNPFYFNDTLAYLFHADFGEEEIKKEGYLWRDEVIKVDIPEGAELVYVNECINKKLSSEDNIFRHPDTTSPSGSLEGKNYSDDSEINSEGQTLKFFQGFDSSGVWQINPAILKKVVQDEKGNAYRVIKEEYDFLMKYGLPLPTSHRFARIRDGVKND